MIDLDNNATTKPLPEVVSAVQEALERTWHNPSSVHRGGQEARRVVELARASLARLIGASPKSLTFTSGGTEAIDLALRGVMESAPPARDVLVTTRVEHASVRALAEHYEAQGRVRYLALDAHGVVDLTRLGEVLDERVRVLSVQWANNETGAVQPVRAIAAAARRAGAFVHSDATQWVGKMPTDVEERGPGAPPAWLDLLTFAPHKFHGPKGVGVLWARPGVPLRPRLLGTQERERRGGTENVPGIAGAGAAGEAARAWLADEGARVRAGASRDEFERRVLEACRTNSGAVVNGPASGGPNARLWNTTNIAFPRLEAEAILLALSERGVYASAGAACSSGSLEPSPVLLAMGVGPERAHGSVRFSLSRFTTREEVEEAARVVGEVVGRMGG